MRGTVAKKYRQYGLSRSERRSIEIADVYLGYSADYELPDSKKYRDSVAYYRMRPVEFVERVIRPELPMQAWQKAAMLAVRDNKRTAIASCQGAGKTAVAAWIILWYLVTRPMAQVPCTAPGMHLLRTILWKELHKWIRHSARLDAILEWTATAIRHKGRDLNGRDFGDEWAAIARTTTAHRSEDGEEKQAEGLAGFHSKYLLFVLDEASGIPREHCRTAEGTLTGYENKVLYLGNPIRTDGRFAEIFGDENERPYWKLFNVSAIPNGTYMGPSGAEEVTDVEWVSTIADRDDALKWIRTMSVQHFDVQSRKLGRFPIKSAIDTGFSVFEIQAAQKRKYVCKAGDEVQIGVDCARFGDDEFVICVRRGCKITRTIIRQKSSVPEEVGLIKKTIKEEALESLRLEGIKTPSADQIARAIMIIGVYIDQGDGGGGGGVVDTLHEDGYGNVIGINFGGSAIEFDRFANLAAEMWLGHLKEAMQWLDLSETIEHDLQGTMGPDKKMAMQLTTRKYKYTGGGLLGEQKRLEGKDEMKRRGLKSPDRGDAICLASVRPPSPGVY